MNPQDLKYGADRRPILEKLKDCAELNVNELYRENACHDASSVIMALIEACERALELLEPFDDPELSLGLGNKALPPLRAALAKARRDR